MKFLCMECDQAMKLMETRGPDSGSMTVIFGCPACGRQMAMLTNPMETQMVRSLDVQIGGKKQAAQPMEMLRSSLAGQREAPDADPAAAPQSTPASEAQPPQEGSRCPFSSAVGDAFDQANTDELDWTPEAEARMEKIPGFVRGMVRRGIEQHARDHGLKKIDAAVLEEIRGKMGI